jgi:transcriptional regulator with XRE-family HTH domain
MKQYPYKSYVFRQVDPIVDALQPALRSHKAAELSKLSGVSASTMSNWKKKKTRRPQFCTVTAVALAAGYYGIDFVDGVPVLRADPKSRLKVVNKK